MEDNRKTDEQKSKRQAAMRSMYMILGFAAAMGVMADGGYLQDGGYMGEDFDDELADMV